MHAGAQVAGVSFGNAGNQGRGGVCRAGGRLSAKEPSAIL